MLPASSGIQVIAFCSRHHTLEMRFLRQLEELGRNGVAQNYDEGRGEGFDTMNKIMLASWKVLDGTSNQFCTLEL
jgi:hypothetical protein